MILFKDKYRIPSARLKGWDYRNRGAYFITICVKDRLNHFGRCENGRMILNEAGEIADKYWRTLPDHFNHVGLGEFVVMPNHIHGILVLDPPVETLHCNVSGNTGKKIENDAAIQPDMQINDGNVTVDNRNEMGDVETLQCNVSRIGVNENMENDKEVQHHRPINDGNVMGDNKTLQCNVSTTDANEKTENNTTIRPDTQINDGNVTVNNETLQCNVSTRREKQFMSQISPKSGSVSTIVRSYKSACTKWINSHLSDLNFQWQERFHDHIIRNHEEYLRIENYIINNPENWKEDKFYTA